MSNPAKSVDQGQPVCNTEQDEWRETPPASSDLKSRIRREVEGVLALLDEKDSDRSFDQVEESIRSRVFILGRLFLAYFLARRHERSRPEVESMKRKGFHERLPQPRLLGTFFGKVRYWRTYLRRSEGGGGVYPLDVSLGLPADGFSLNVMGRLARLATLVSYDQVASLFFQFFSWSPSKMTIEKAVLGLGRYTGEWFEKAPAPDDEGEVLVIQIDSKATPTATDTELQRRRGKRDRIRRAASPRHRGRQKRGRYGSKPRRRKGDKSKNGRAATLVVIYTLKTAMREGKPVLLGPRNRKVYASYAGKRHAMAIARREADKRGFPRGTGKLVQIVSDGDDDFCCYVREFFPGAIHTLDVMHVMEKIWEAGGCLYPEGSVELRAWVKKIERLVYRGKTADLLAEIYQGLEGIPMKGPGTKSRRERLASIHDYLFMRVDQMNYGWLRRKDLEIASGSVEGAVRHVIAKRFDNGSMRWIRERAEALLQLRCIEMNGDWDAFMEFVGDKVAAKLQRHEGDQRVLTWTAAPLPTLGLTA
jgi:hypothetical protein